MGEGFGGRGSKPFSTIGRASRHRAGSHEPLTPSPSPQGERGAHPNSSSCSFFGATTGRSWRPAHLHFRIRAPGQRTLVTHLFDRTSPNLDGDAVFGVRPSLVVDFVPQPAGTAADGRVMDRDYATLDYDFVMSPAG